MQKKDSPKGDELEILGMLANNYENENFPVGFPDPVANHLPIKNDVLPRRLTF